MERGPILWQHKQLLIACGRTQFLSSSLWIRNFLLTGLCLQLYTPFLGSLVPSHSFLSFLFTAEQRNFLSVSHTEYLSQHFCCLSPEYFCHQSLTFSPQMSRYFLLKDSFFPKEISGQLLFRVTTCDLHTPPHLITLSALLGQTTLIPIFVFIILSTA